MSERTSHIAPTDTPLEQVAQRAEELYPELKGARMTIIERAARAAAEAMGYDYDSQDGPTADPNTPMTEDLRAAVVAVLQAIREPNPECVARVVESADDVIEWGDYGEFWQAMIDAALGEG